MRFLGDGSLLAIGWGDTVTCTLNRLGYLLGHTGASVVTLTGGVSTYVHMIGGPTPALARARRLFMIPSPLVASTPATAAALLREPAVCDVLAMAHAADYALTGIGAMNENASFVKGGYVSTAIRSVLATGRLDMLITDEPCAIALLGWRGRPRHASHRSAVLNPSLRSPPALRPRSDRVNRCRGANHHPAGR